MTEETTVPNTEEQAGGAEPVATETAPAQETVEGGNGESASAPEAPATSEGEAQSDASASTVACGEGV